MDKTVPPAVLTIAGSDCSGGAGIQADLKTFEACGIYGMSIITSVVAENTCGLLKSKKPIFDIPVKTVMAQLTAIFTDIRPAAIKIGMIHTAKIAHVIAVFLAQHASNIPIVIDPVIAAKDGSILMASNRTILKNELFSLAYMLTPNIPEAELLSGIKITNLEDRITAAKIICSKYGCVTVLIKGGHDQNSISVTDILYDSCTGSLCSVTAQRVDTKNTHGTGCTYASAIAAFLAQGYTAEKSLQYARKYITGAIEHSFAIGNGSGPLCHNWTYFDGKHPFLN